ncbi:FliM/FliN family flagellar motor switch protein [Pseudoduganella namucuonensis]|uniref:Type III secretion protein Q n=1 Tax=Pseudoduganella namucuonensis TaxID=1035707 RepID=A0A1I7LW58_9BURK|nr:FliM/FliN family flagellar motor switch protein [Pseudoduganella namucuonensis]SFV13931.1 type III secretion protein Q [Pseudoduganella namucuonensis]
MPDTVDPTSLAPRAAVILPADSPLAAAARAPAPASLGEARAQLARMVRRGCFVNLPHAPALLSVELADDAAGARAEWRDSLFLAPADGPGADGRIEIADGARLLQGLTGIHPGQARSSGTAPWLAAALAGRLAATPFAGLGVAAPGAPAHMEEHCCLRLTLRSRRHLISSLARAPAAAWLAFLSRCDWSFERAPARPWLAAVSEETISIARHTLPSGALSKLAPGDVIVPDSPRFGPGGEGRIRLGHRHVRVRYAAPNSLEILDVERKVTTDDMEYEMEHGMEHGIEQEAGASGADPLEDEPEDGRDAGGGEAVDGEAPGDEIPDGEAEALFAELDAAPDADLADASPDTAGDVYAGLDAFPVTLAFELGKVSLPLADARTLGPGAVVLLDGGSPASVAIVSAGRTLGRGEIVDVAGQLGIRVIQWGAP